MFLSGFASFIDKLGVRAGIAHDCECRAISGNINENFPKTVVCPMCEAEICRWLHSKLGANFLVWRDVIWVVCWAELRVSQQSIHALDSAHFEKNSCFCEVDVNLKKALSCELSCIPLSSKMPREIPQAVAAHHSARLNCCGQYFMFGPPSHALGSLPVVCLIFVSEFCGKILCGRAYMFCCPLYSPPTLTTYYISSGYL